MDSALDDLLSLWSSFPVSVLTPVLFLRGFHCILLVYLDCDPFGQVLCHLKGSFCFILTCKRHC